MAAALVGGAFLSASLQVLFDRLASREVLNLFSKRKTNVDGLLKKLKRKLNLLNHVLDDADVKQFTDTNVRAWSDEARDAVYQADDILSEIAYEARRRQVESDPEFQSSQVNTTVISSSYFTSFDDYIAPKLGEILQLLEDLIQDAASLGLKKGVRPGANMPTNRSSSSLVVDVYGRDSEKKQLIDRLLLDETAVDVIPVVGMGGMGKTTLVQFAYNDDRVDEKFKTMKAWVCVSKQFDVLQATKTILESITGRSCTFTDLNQVQESLKKELNGMKFLIVLDDVWNKNYGDWDTLRAPFRTGAPGSKIIVTTRIQDAADIMRSGPVINLAELSDDYCWQLFADIAFGESSPSSHTPQLEEIGRKIVKRCRGLPLAVKSLAGLLRSKQRYVGEREDEWENVLNSDFWDLPEDECDILPALRLSYHYLPSYLKQCFAFCSLFPKNHIFEEKKTVSLWIAQKFVLPSKASSYGLEGKKYFRELLSMSFFQRFFANSVYFVMHDLIHDLAQVVSGQFSFRFDGTHQHEITDKVRHCSYGVGGFQQLQAATEVTTLRTFLPIEHICGGLDISVLSRQKHMRVLALPGYYQIINHLADLVGSLIHLQYLDLSGVRDMGQLPESICRLYNLETLLLAGCSSLTSLPENIGKLTSLRMLDIRGTHLKEMPIQLKLLKRLQYLPLFVVGKEGGLAIGGLKELNNLRGELKISGLENVRGKKDALEAKLVDKQHLETLALEWGGDTDDSRQEREVLDYLQPCRNLKDLTIRKYGGTTFPDWLGDRCEFTQMVQLRLEDCSNCFLMPPLGQLPCLKELFVEGMGGVVVMGEEFLGSHAGTYQPFPLLESLCFTDMPAWEKWSLPGTGEFPKLRKLEIINCPLLASFADNGLPTTLKQIRFSRCPKLELSLSEGIEMCPSVEKLDLNGCLSLNLFPNVQRLYIEGDDNLSILNVGGCPQQAGGRLANLALLTIDKCKNLKALPEGMCDLFPSLETIHLSKCPEIESLFEVSLLSKLRRLEIDDCEKLTSFQSDWGLHRLPSLRELYIRGVENEDVESFPNEGLLPSTLTALEIFRFGNLKKLNWRGIRQLTSLERLEIGFCDQLESLPDEGLPQSLSTLEIVRCPLLTPRCKKDSGDDWPKIAHIPTIELDFVYLSSA